MHSVYIIIVTYNGAKWIDKCLQSVFCSTVPLSVIVVDNLSTDNTKSIVKENYPLVRLIENDINLGFGKANNIGIREALLNDPDYVFLLNQDAWINPNTIEGLITIHQLNPDFGILSPIHLNGDGSAVDFNFSQTCNADSCPGFLSDLFLKTSRSIYTIKFVMAALWLVPAKIFSEVGLFDPMFPHYGEDHDYIQRTINFGYKVGICPDYIGFHDRAQRAVSEKRNMAIRHTYYLCILKNNNRKLLNAFINFNLACLNAVLILISEGKWAMLFKEIRVWFKMWLLMPVIIKNRKYTKMRGAFLR